jgi:exodeoxyribonuclease V alpha subunit
VIQKADNRHTRDVAEILSRLHQSPFRSSIHLQAKELDYLRQKGMNEVLRHAAGFIEKRLAPVSPVNDGKQTPWRDHPVFVAQHATATCCRGCLQKWHQIPRGKTLTAEEQQYIVEVIAGWLSQQADPG